MRSIHRRRCGERRTACGRGRGRPAAKRLPGDFAQVVERRMTYRSVRGELKARGWRWVCGGCKKLVRTVYLPLRDRNLAEYFGVKVEGDEVDGVAEMPRTFACTRCHRVRYFSRVDRHGWNQLIAHATGGLLYGREVRKPEYWKATRKRAYRPAKGRKPSKRREEVRERLLAGMGIGEVALDLGISVNCVNNYTRVIYREAGVHSYRELRRKAGVADIVNPMHVAARNDSI
jgi:DNA-binding CsgD family transcriptional regulator